MSDTAAVKTIRFSELPRFTGALQQDTDLVGVVGNTDAYRISLNSVQASFVSYTEDYDDAPTLPTTIGWTDGVIHTWDGQQWGATPRYTRNQSDLDAGTRFLLVDKQQSLSEEEVSQGRSNLSIADAVPGGSTGLVSLSADGVALDEAGVVTGSQVYRYIQENVNARVSYKILTDKSKLPAVGVSGVIYLIPQPGTSGTYQQMTWNTETKAYISVGLVAIENITVSPVISETSTNNTAAGSRAVYTLVTDTAATLTAEMDSKDAVVLSEASQKVSDLLTQNVSVVDATHAPSSSAVYAALESQKSEVEEAADNRFNAKIVSTVSSTDTTHVPTSAAVAAHVAASRTEVLTQLPASGETDKLYVVGTKCYVWDKVTYTFKEVGGYIGNPMADILTSTVRPGDSAHAPTSDAVYSHTNKALASILTSDVLGGAGVINKAATPKGVADYVQSKAITSDKVRKKWEAAYYTSTTDIPSMNAVYEAIHSIHDITGDLNVTGKVTAGSVAATGALSVGGAATLNGSLTVNGATVFSDPVTVNDSTRHYASLLANSGIEVYTGVNDHGFLTVDGDARFSGPVTVQSDVYYSMAGGDVMPLTPDYKEVEYSSGLDCYRFTYRPNGLFYISGFSMGAISKVVVEGDASYSGLPGSCRLIWNCRGSGYSSLTVQTDNYSKVIALEDNASYAVIDITNTATKDLIVGYVGGDIAEYSGGGSGTETTVNDLTVESTLYVGGTATFSNNVKILAGTLTAYSTSYFSGHAYFTGGASVYDSFYAYSDIVAERNLTVYSTARFSGRTYFSGDSYFSGYMTGIKAIAGTNYVAVGDIYSPSAIDNDMRTCSYASTYQNYSGLRVMPLGMCKGVVPYAGYSDASDALYSSYVPINLMPNQAMFCGSLYSQASVTTFYVAPAYSSSTLYSHASIGPGIGTDMTLADHFPESIIMWKGKTQVNMYVYDRCFTGYSPGYDPVYSVSFSALPSTALGYNIVTMVLAPYSFSGMTNGMSGRYYIKSVNRY